MNDVQKQKLKEVALLALTHYDLEVSNVEFLTEETNVFFKVTTADDKLFALKIFEEASSKLSDNLAEVFFIDIVKDRTDLVVPTVLKTKHGKQIVIVKDEENNDRRVALYEWMNGDEIDEKETLDDFYEIGKIAATLHLATKGIVYPDNISPKRWDKVYYYIGEEAVYLNEEYKPFINDEFVEVMNIIIPHLNQALKSLYNNQPSQLIHGDLNPYNILKYKKDYRIIDFEEAFDALPIHDLAIHFFYYEHDERFNFEDVVESFMRGYHTIIPTTNFKFEDIEMLMCARRVNFLNYALTIMDDPSEYISKNLKRVQDYIDKYLN